MARTLPPNAVAPGPTDASPAMPATLIIAPDKPSAPDVSALLRVHLGLMHAASPPESVHALPVDALEAPGIAFYSLRDGGALVGIGALARITARHCEIKSMHVRAERRDRGAARHLLEGLLAEARRLDYARVSLETGVEPVFAAARALYATAGFRICPPFAGYGPDPNSVFMTLALNPLDGAMSGSAVP